MDNSEKLLDPIGLAAADNLATKLVVDSWEQDADSSTKRNAVCSALRPSP